MLEVSRCHVDEMQISLSRSLARSTRVCLLSRFIFSGIRFQEKTAPFSDVPRVRFSSSRRRFGPLLPQEEFTMSNADFARLLARPPPSPPLEEISRRAHFPDLTRRKRIIRPSRLPALEFMQIHAGDSEYSYHSGETIPGISIKSTGNTIPCAGERDGLSLLEPD
jgi:hypothetical protein